MLSEVWFLVIFHLIFLEELLDNACFICNIEKFEFEKQGMTFKRHCLKEHYLWNYVFFVTYLSSKEYKDMQALELQIWDKIQVNDISWLPFD